MLLKKVIPWAMLMIPSVAMAGNQIPTLEEKTKSPLSLYGDTYFVIGADSAPEVKKNSSVKFQVSFKFETFLDHLFIGYTQRSYLDFEATSSPFSDHNFSPELFYAIPLNKEGNGIQLGCLQLGFNHESNGQGGTTSRSWNRVYAELALESHGFYFRPMVWFPFFIADENSDIVDYYGYVEPVLGYKSNIGLEVSAAGRIGNSGKGSIRGDLTYALNQLQLFHNSPVHLWLQSWYGYGEELVGYNLKSTAIRMGIGLRY